MGRISRLIFVSVPFALTVASLICLLICTVPNNNVYLIDIDTANLSVSASELATLLSDIGLKKRGWGDVSGFTKAALTDGVDSWDGVGSSSSASDVASALDSTNITAAELGLADHYTIGLWNYCAKNDSNTDCSSPEFNFVPDQFNLTKLNETATALGGDVPDDVEDAVKTYGIATKWMEIVYIIAVIATAAEIVFGLFALFSQMGSCCTWLISGIASLTVSGASIIATVLASISVGALDSAGKLYGLSASINTDFLAATWLAVAFSMGAGLFWLFSICCCAGGSSGRRSHKYKDIETEKAPAPGAYQRVEEPSYVTGEYAGQQQGIYESGYGHAQPKFAVPSNQKAERNMAYEPYSHGAI